jgi:hypothetical protein
MVPVVVMVIDLLVYLKSAGFGLVVVTVRYQSHILRYALGNLVV